MHVPLFPPTVVPCSCSCCPRLAAICPQFLAVPSSLERTSTQPHQPATPCCRQPQGRASPGLSLPSPIRLFCSCEALCELLDHSKVVRNMTLALRGGAAAVVQGLPRSAIFSPPRPCASSNRPSLAFYTPLRLAGGRSSFSDACDGAAISRRLDRRCAGAAAAVCSLPSQAADKATEASKDQHAPSPADREVGAASTATLAAAAATLKHSKKSAVSGRALEWVLTSV